VASARRRRERKRSSRSAARIAPSLAAADVRVSLVAALVAFGFYLPRLCPTLSLMGDSAMFVAASASWGIAQPPGYPLFTLLGKLATWLPIGELAWRVHLTSALYHAAAVGLVAAIIHKLTGSRAAAFGGALFLAFSRGFFLGSHYAEVFPLNDAFTALVSFLGLRVYQTANSSPDLAWRALAALAFGAGLASAHHQMIALTAPGLLVFLARGRPRLLAEPRRLAGLAALFAVPYVGFHLLLLAAAAQNPVPNWGDVHDLGSLVQLMTRQDYGGLFSPFLGARGEPASEQLGVYGAALFRHFGFVGIALSAVGSVWLGRRAPVPTLALTLVWIFSGPVFAILNRLPIESEAGIAFAERFTTMSEVPLAVLLGAGLRALEQTLSLALHQRVARLVAGLVFVVPLAKHAGDVDLSADRRGMDFAEDLLLPAEAGSLVLLTGDASNGAQSYLCGAQRRCGQTIAFSPGQLHLPWFVRQLQRRHSELALPPAAGTFVTVRELIAEHLGRRTVYVAPMLLEREPPLRELYGYLPEGLLLRVVAPVADVDAERARFVALARLFAEGEGCAGCGIRHADLIRPSLETTLLQAYVDAWVNHARVLRLYFGEAELARRFEERAESADPGRARELL
jgi:hypothetical protein